MANALFQLFDRAKQPLDDITLVVDLGLEYGIVAGLVYDGHVGTRLDEQLHTVEASIEGGPVQRRVAGIVHCIDKPRRRSRRLVRFQGKEEPDGVCRLQSAASPSNTQYTPGRGARTDVSIRSGIVQRRVPGVGIDCDGDQLGLGALVRRRELGEEGGQLGGLVGAGEVENVIDGIVVQGGRRHCCGWGWVRTDGAACAKAAPGLEKFLVGAGKLVGLRCPPMDARGNSASGRRRQ